MQPVLTLTSRVMTRDHAADLATPTVPPPRDIRTLGRFLRPTRLIPTDGIVKTTADAITKGAGTDIDKARAIYDWIVENTFRDPKVVGCGIGDIRFMLESKNLGGKCADLNALFVGLARAAGLPARDVYGLRVARSEKGLRQPRAERRTTRQRRSTAAPRCIWSATAGCRSIPRTCARSCSRSRRAT